MSMATHPLRLVREHLHRPCRNLRYSMRHSSSSSLPTPRLNYRNITENISTKSQNLINRNPGTPADILQQISILHRETLHISRQVDDLRAQRTSAGQAVRAAHSASEKATAIANAKSLKEQIHLLEQTLLAKEVDLYSLAASLPNDTHPSTPLGPEANARVISMHGPEPIPADPRRDHVRIATKLDMLDMEAGATVTGSSWYFLRNEGALLELALINYAMGRAVAEGFTPVTVPDVVKSDIAHRCGFAPRDEASSQNYYLHTKGDDSSKFVLAGTAEIPLAGMFAGETMQEHELPILVAGLGRAFRAEAGARGADTRGLYRVHQFSKVELFAITAGATGKESEEMIERLVRLQKGIFDGLSIPYKVLLMPTEELGASAFMKYDMEAWMPGRGSWGEISSTSNCTDYQSRRLHITYAPTPTSNAPSSKQAFAHTLNGTAAAIPRLMVALIENGARFSEEGDMAKVVGLDLPKVLQPYWLGKVGEKIRFV